MREVKFVDLGRQYQALRPELIEVFDRVSRSGDFVLGEELERFEAAFASYCGAAHAIGLGNGSDALHLPLLALGLGEGDEAITAPNTFVATAWAIARTGAKLVFADVGEDMNLDPEKAAEATTDRTKAIVPVHLTGRVARMEAFESIARERGLHLVEDAAQAVGARRNGRRAGSFGRCAGFSLHPLKNLHAHGDGGVCLTHDADLAMRLRRYRNHGLESRDRCLFWGVNSRLDCFQAAICRVKLAYLDAWNARRRALARRYRQALSGVVRVPDEAEGEEPVYHRFVIRQPLRDALQEHLRRCGVGSAVNYPVPLHLQPAARYLGYGPGSFPVAERLAGEILSLPLYPELSDDEADFVIESVLSFFK